MPRVNPSRASIKKFLDGAVIDPNKKGNYVEQQLVEIGDPSYYETRVVEFMQEARRIRERMKTAQGKGLATLKELYTLTMTKAATAIAVSAGKVNEPATAKAPKRARSKDPRGSSQVPQGQGLGSDGDPR